MTAVEAPPLGLTRDAKHWYSWQGGPKYPGVTSIIAMLDKSGPLVGWASRETALAAVRNLPMLQTMYAQSGEKATADWLKTMPGYQRETAAGLGTRIHVLAEAIVREERVELQPEEAPFIDSYLRWRATVNPRIVNAEFMVFSETYGYGGTADIAFWLNDELWLADYKTGKAAYAETALQLAGLHHADFAGKAGDAKKYKVPPATRFGVVHVRPEGVELIPYRVGDEEWTAFLACRALHRWTTESAPTVKEGK